MYPLKQYNCSYCILICYNQKNDKYTHFHQSLKKCMYNNQIFKQKLNDLMITEDFGFLIL